MNGLGIWTALEIDDSHIVTAITFSIYSFRHKYCCSTQWTLVFKMLSFFIFYQIWSSPRTPLQLHYSIHFGIGNDKHMKKFKPKLRDPYVSGKFKNLGVHTVPNVCKHIPSLQLRFSSNFSISVNQFDLKVFDNNSTKFPKDIFGNWLIASTSKMKVRHLTRVKVILIAITNLVTLQFSLRETIAVYDFHLFHQRTLTRLSGPCNSWVRISYIIHK